MVSLNPAQTLVKSCGRRLEFHVLLAKSEIVVEVKLDMQSIWSSPDLHILCARDTIMINDPI